MAPKPLTRSGVTPDESNKGQIRQANEILILTAAERVFAGAGFGGATMAAIAEAAGLPKANLHYYFGSKQDLYRAVLARTLEDWLMPLNAITPDADPAQAIEHYIRAKMGLSAKRPHASKVFANELLHGAPVVKNLLMTELRDMVQAKAVVIDGWVAAGRMAKVDATHLFFSIWAATQTYADFDVQVGAVLGVDSLQEAHYARATEHVVALMLRGCGLSR
jgi:TetR/AcrR family transcriptional regulator